MMETICKNAVLNRALLLGCAFTLGAALAGCSQDQSNASAPGQFLQLSTGSPQHRAQAELWIADHWQPGFVQPAAESLKFISDREVRAAMIDLLHRKTGQDFGDKPAAWQRWAWAHGPPPAPHYARTKADLYGMVDVRYRHYFTTTEDARIPLTEVQWLGLRRRDDLKPLKHIPMVAAAAAAIDAQQPVYGVFINGHARAYARATVAQHGVIYDRVGKQRIVLIHDKLSGSTVAYTAAQDTRLPRLASSGFVFRGDALYYDQATSSLWSPLIGRAVIGPQTRTNTPQLQAIPVVATHWAAWRQRHPSTQVSAGDPATQQYLADHVNYRVYVSSKQLVPTGDAKTRVLALVHNGQALAIPLSQLQASPIYRDSLGGDAITVVTDASNAARGYLTGGVHLQRWRDADTLVAADGSTWHLTETGLRGPDNSLLPRLPERRARWAAWHGAHTDSKLAK